MLRISLRPKVSLSVALGLLFALASTPARASMVRVNGPEPAFRSFELIPPDKAGELPSELRADEGAPSYADSLGLAETGDGHKVRLTWVVRENRELSGYRVTLVSADGIAGHLAARWWVQPEQGIPAGEGLKAYSAEISLSFAGQAPVAAAIEAVDTAGHAVLLGVHRSIVEADARRSTIKSRAEAISGNPTVLQVGRLAPAARAASSSPLFRPSPSETPDGAWSPPLVSSLDPDGAVSPRGPPAAGITI